MYVGALLTRRSWARVVWAELTLARQIRLGCWLKSLGGRNDLNLSSGNAHFTAHDLQILQGQWGNQRQDNRTRQFGLGDVLHRAERICFRWLARGQSRFRC